MEKFIENTDQARKELRSFLLKSLKDFNNSTENSKGESNGQ